DQDEQVRPPGQGSLDAVRPDPVRSTGGPGGVLHEPGGAGGHSGGPDQPAHGGGTIGGPALPGEGGTDERDPQPGRGSGDGGPGVLGGDGALQPGRGTAGDAERSPQPGPYSRPDRPHLRPSRGDGRGGDGPEPELAGEAGVPDAATSPDRGGRPAHDARAGDPRPDPPAAGPAAPAVATGAAFRPESQDDLAPAGQVARFRANVAAIEVVQALGEDDRQATAEEQQILARWSSWGAIPQVFDEANEEWAERRGHLRGLLAEQPWEAARRTTANAHYTDAAYVREIWQTVQDLGLTSGQVLEPGSGVGTFIGMAPDSVAMTGVELDPTTAAISQALYPKAAIQAGSFADTRLPDGVADGVVGNVPFADVALYDPVHNAGNHAMHNHFIIKSLALTRPGGMVAVLTSRYTMDATNPAARQEMNHLGDLVGAVRLPTGAHQRAAGTEAVTDLLILRRRPDGAPKRDTSWERATTVTVDGEPTKINTYF